MVKKIQAHKLPKASLYCSMWVVYWRLLNWFSGGLLNILLMLGLHHRCFPENFRKIFQNTGWLILTFNIYSFDFQKRKIVVLEVFQLYFFCLMFPKHPENSSVFRNINKDFYNFAVFVTASYLFSKKFSFHFVNLWMFYLGF